MKGKVNGMQGIRLENIFRNILWKKKNQIDFFIIAFYISYERGIKTSLK